MRTTSRPYLPPVPPGLRDAAVQRYLTELNRALQQALIDLYTDVAQGQGGLTTFTAAPAATDVAANQIVLRTDAGNEKIYANIGGTMKSVSLT